MLSLGNRDGRKGLGFGGVEMEDPELEEGEACSYPDVDSAVDPDVALSYLDEKLHNVLGHFQKDFEGGVSAENLGAKFGGYGSFLPTYQRSPILSHPRTPKLQNPALKSQSNLQLEGGFHNITAPVTAPIQVQGPAVNSTRAVYSTKPLSAHDPVKLDVGMQHTYLEETTSGVETSKKSTLPDQKKLKVRIRVGSDNLSTQTKAELYSGLGLDASPSSFEDSPESEGWSQEPHHAPDESPNSILQKMTSFPVQGNKILSPLSEDLAYLNRNKKRHKGRRPGSVSKSETRKPHHSFEGSGSSRKNREVSMPKNKRSSGINGMLLETGSKEIHDLSGNVPTERDDEASACEKLISNALKLPLLSTSDCTPSNLLKGAGRVSGMYRGTNKDAFSMELSHEEPADLFFNRDDYLDDNKPTARVFSNGNIWEDRKENFVGDMEARPVKYLNDKSGKTYGSPEAELNSLKAVIPPKQERHRDPNLKSEVKVGLLDMDVMNISAAKDHTSSKGKSKTKTTQSHNHIAEVDEGKPRDGLSTQPKFEKNSSQVRVQNGIRKSRDTYMDIFGEVTLENEENEAEALEIPSGFGPKGAQIADVGKMSSNVLMKDKTCSKKVEKPVALEPHSAPPMTGPASDALPPQAPVLIEEHWVCCDKCQKWRLLPVGRSPDDLPEKWLCSMLDWLPGMNRCDIEEEETTKALIFFYQVADPSDKNFNHIGGSTSGALLAGIQHPGSRLNSAPSAPKKKNGLCEMSNIAGSHDLADLANPKRGFEPSVKSRSLNDITQSPSVHDLENSRLKKSVDLDKNKKLSKEKQKIHDRSSDGGATNNANIQNKRGEGQDCFRASKKHKSENSTDEGWLSESDHHGLSRNGGPNTNSILPYTSAGGDQHKSMEAIHFRNHTSEENETSQTSSKKAKDRVRHSLDANVSSSKKRKEKTSQESMHSESLLTAGLKNQKKRGSLKDEYIQKDCSKEKKARLSSQEFRAGQKRESDGEREDISSLKDQKLAQDPGSTLCIRNMDDVDLSRRDLASTQPLTEATSSSSKISSSRKSKGTFQDMKGSPVESVSSSPLRSRSKDRYRLKGNDISENDYPPDGVFVTGSPKRYSDHEVDGKSVTMGHFSKENGRKDKASGVTYRGMTASSMLDFRDPVSGDISGSKSKTKNDASTGLLVNHSVNKVANTCDKYPGEPQSLDQGVDEEGHNITHKPPHGSLRDKKGSSTRSKDKVRKSKSGSDKINVPNLFDDSQDVRHPHGGKQMDEQHRERIAAKSYKLEKKHDVKTSTENSRKGNQMMSGSREVQDAKYGYSPSQDPSICKKSLVRQREGTLNTMLSEKTDQLETGSDKAKSLVQPPNIGECSTENGHSRHTLESNKGNEIDKTYIESSERDSSLKGLKALRRGDNQIGAQPPSRHPTPNGQRAKDLNAPSPARKDSSSQSASNALKEAKNLKHMADRVKSSGSNAESISLYFEAVLKFLLGASLLESSTSDTRHGDKIQSIQIYRSTAKLCEFCAYEYEKAKDMASAALAYKCTEVAYMRVIYSYHSSADRDRHELHTALQMAPPGESPSSSASDVDNLNNAATGDKVLVAKGVSSPQIAGSHVISARNRPGFTRLLNFAQDVNFAMEASKKSLIALAAANTHLEQVHNEEGISAIKRALDLSFQDVEGLLRLVRLGIEAISE